MIQLEHSPIFAILTSGGDAPGMNTAIAYLNRFAVEKGWKTLGIRGGFAGLLQRDVTDLIPSETWKRARHGSTHLGSSRLPDFLRYREDLRIALAELGVSKLAVLGGNGSLKAAAHLASDTRAVVGIPATIDNDIEGSDESIGFNTAVNTGVRMLDGIHDAAEAMGHVFALEVLGGGQGTLALAVAEAGGADAVLKHPLHETELVRQLKKAVDARRYAILVTPEYYPDVEGVVERVSAALGETRRFGRIGHAQRGGTPDARDRVLARRLSTAAVGALEAGQSGCVLYKHAQVIFHPFAAPTPKSAR